MAKEQEQTNNSNEDLNDIFNYNPEDNQEEEEDYSDYDGLANEQKVATPEVDEAAEADSPLFQEKKEDEVPEGGPTVTEDDLADLNAKLGTDYQTVEELKSFLNKSDAVDETASEETELTSAENQIEFYGPLLDQTITNDETLMRREYEAVARGEGKKLADEDTQYEINDKIQELIDSKQLDLRADKLRGELKTAVLDPALKVKSDVEKSRTERTEAQQKTDKETLQNEFAEIFKSKNFFGIVPEKEKIEEAYKRVTSGDYIQKLQSDKKALARTAMMEAYFDEISKKTSNGSSYSDGVRSVVDEFKSRPDKSSGADIVKAQKKGTAGGADASKGLMASLSR